MNDPTPPVPEFDADPFSRFKRLLSEAPRENTYKFALKALTHPSGARANMSLMFVLDADTIDPSQNDQTHIACRSLTQSADFTHQLHDMINQGVMSAALESGYILIEDERMDRVISGDASAGPFAEHEFGLLIEHFPSIIPDAIKVHSLTHLFHLSVSILLSHDLTLQLVAAQKTNAEILALSSPQV